MLASYHTHTYRCKHATGKEEEYIEKAIAEGVKILGFSDHAPMPYKNGYESFYKMGRDELGEYFSTLLMLKDRYRKDIEIKIGLETEYYKSIFDDCLDFWRPYPIDYLILGQHFIPEETGASTSPSSRPTDDKSILTLYTDTVIEAMNTGLITYVAHPDLMNYVGSDTDFYLSECRRLISEAVRLGIPLEYNLLGMTLERSYPKDLFWRTVSEYNVKTVIGCDSHEPHRVADKNEIERAEGYLHSLGIYPLDEIELVKPKF